jgi:hypothetical protein
VGQAFQANQGINAISQTNGNAVWVRSSTFASTTPGQGQVNAYMGGNGKPTSWAKAEMAHEMLHKRGYIHPFLENSLGPGYAHAAQMFGSMAVSVAIMEKCY